MTEPRRGPGRPRIPDDEREERIRRDVAYAKRVDDVVAAIGEVTFRSIPETYRFLVALGIATFVTAEQAAPELDPPALRHSLIQGLPDNIEWREQR